LPPPVDYFVVLEQPRRPWLDPGELKQKHQQLTLVAHPDRPSSDRVAMDFAAINEAYRVLSDPKQRLQHLLRLKEHEPSASQSIPNELLELFGKIGSLVQEIDSLLEKVRTTDSALGKSLLQPNILKARERAGELVDESEKLYENALEYLRKLDKSWEEQPLEVLDELKALLNRFAYLGRWIEQLRERHFQLSV
jgi:curved DNA-binding protein CbpA